jgi:hypothetical protein
VRLPTCGGPALRVTVLRARVADEANHRRAALAHVIVLLVAQVRALFFGALAATRGRASLGFTFERTRAFTIGRGVFGVELSSRRHRAVTQTTLDEPEREMSADDRGTSEVINLMADALEQIALTTTDATARDLAEEALALFQGR